MAKIAVLGIDLGKNVCSLVGLDEAGNVVLRRRMKRGGLPSFAERLAPYVIAMERAAARIIWGGFLQPGGMSSG
jgi:hypothetical protein